MVFTHYLYTDLSHETKPIQRMKLNLAEVFCKCVIYKSIASAGLAYSSVTQITLMPFDHSVNQIDPHAYTKIPVSFSVTLTYWGVECSLRFDQSLYALPHQHTTKLYVFAHMCVCVLSNIVNAKVGRSPQSCYTTRTTCLSRVYQFRTCQRLCNVFQMSLCVYVYLWRLRLNVNVIFS